MHVTEQIIGYFEPVFGRNGLKKFTIQKKMKSRRGSMWSVHLVVDISRISTTR